MNTIKLMHKVNRSIFPHGPASESFHAIPLGGNLAQVENVLAFAPPCTLGDHVEFDPETHEFIRVVDRVRQPLALVVEGRLQDEEVVAIKQHFAEHDCPTESMQWGPGWLISVAPPAVMDDDRFFEIVDGSPHEVQPIKWALLGPVDES